MIKKDTMDSMKVGDARKTKRFSIMVQEIGSGHEVELCQVETNPEDLVKKLRQKVHGRVKRYVKICVRDNAPS